MVLENKEGKKPNWPEEFLGIDEQIKEALKIIEEKKEKIKEEYERLKKISETRPLTKDELKQFEEFIR